MPNTLHQKYYFLQSLTFQTFLNHRPWKQQLFMSWPVKDRVKHWIRNIGREKVEGGLCSAVTDSVVVQEEPGRGFRVVWDTEKPK
jgi:hypothetical protein